MTEPFLGPPLIVPTLDRIDFRHGYSPIFSSLPNELVHRIFQFAAAGDEKTCRVLCEVSSWARALALPHYIPTIILDEVEELDQFLTFPTTRPSPSWVHPLYFTRNLFLSSGIVFVSERDPRTFMPNVMEMCPNVVHIALNGNSFLALVETHVDAPWYHNRGDLEVKILFGGSMADLERGPRLFTAGVSCYGYHHPILRRVRRLVLHNVRAPDLVPVDLEAFPRLTHVAIEYSRSARLSVRDVFQKVLSVTTLQMAVITSRHPQVWDMVLREDPTEECPGIYTLGLPSNSSSNSTLLAWKVNLDADTDIWEEAVKFTNNRRFTNYITSS